MKIVVRDYLTHDGAVYFISQRDNDDFDWMINCLFLKQSKEWYDEDAEPKGDFRIIAASVQPETWNPQVFIDWFMSVRPEGYKATLEF